MTNVISPEIKPYFSTVNLHQLMIDEKLLIEKGAGYKTFQTGNLIFGEGTECLYYHQLSEGRVMWGNSNDEGKEFIQKIIEPGECFGELPLFDDGPYAADAMALEPSKVIRLPKTEFVQLMKDNPDLHFRFSHLLAQRVRYDFFLLKTIVFENPENRIRKLLNYYKSTHEMGSDPGLVKLTRQQIACMTGLRVETVIRAIKSLNQKGQLDINRGKVYF